MHRTLLDFSWQGNDAKLLEKATVLITGGTGSLGVALTEELVRYAPSVKVIILSRDELKQAVMRKNFTSSARVRCSVFARSESNFIRSWRRS